MELHGRNTAPSCLGEPVGEVLQAGTEKQEREQWDHRQLTQPQPVLTGITSGIAPCARERYRLCFRGWSDSLPRILPHSTSYPRAQSELYSFPSLSQSRRCQMWYSPDPPAFWEPSLPCPLSYSSISTNSSAILVSEFAPWTCFIQLPLGSLCNPGWAAATHTEGPQFQVSPGFAQVCVPLNSKTRLAAGRGRLLLPGHSGTWPRG